MGGTFGVIMAAYPVTEADERDFDALVRRVRDKAVRSEGVMLVEHDAEGGVRVSQTGDHAQIRGIGKEAAG